MCIPLSLLGSGSVNKFSRRRMNECTRNEEEEAEVGSVGSFPLLQVNHISFPVIHIHYFREFCAQLFLPSMLHTYLIYLPDVITSLRSFHDVDQRNS
jgi:hypothetical protein